MAAKKKGRKTYKQADISALRGIGKKKAGTKSDFSKLDSLTTKKSKTTLADLAKTSGKAKGKEISALRGLTSGKKKDDIFGKLGTVSARKPAAKPAPRKVAAGKPAARKTPAAKKPVTTKPAPKTPAKGLITKEERAKVPAKKPEPFVPHEPSKGELKAINVKFDWNSFNSRIQNYFKHFDINAKKIPDQIGAFFKTFPKRWKDSPNDERVAWGCIGGGSILFLTSIVLLIVL